MLEFLKIQGCQKKKKMGHFDKPSRTLVETKMTMAAATY
jgi:hypothetical protein